MTPWEQAVQGWNQLVQRYDVAPELYDAGLIVILLLWRAVGYLKSIALHYVVRGNDTRDALHELQGEITKIRSGTDAVTSLQHDVSEIHAILDRQETDRRIAQIETQLRKI